MEETKSQEKEQLLNYSTFTSETGKAIVLEETEETLSYNFGSSLPCGLRQLWYLLWSLFCLVAMVGFVLPSLLVVTLVGWLFRLLFCCYCREGDSNGITTMYNDLRLWLLANRCPRTNLCNLPYVLLWEWLNHIVTFVLFAAYGKLREGSTGGTYEHRKIMAEYYGDWQPFVSGLTCTDYETVQRMMHDPHGARGYVFQTMPNNLAKTFFKDSPVMKSSGSEAHALARGMFLAFLRPAVEMVQRLERASAGGEDPAATRFNQVFDGLYQERLAAILTRVEHDVARRMTEAEAERGGKGGRGPQPTVDPIVSAAFDAHAREFQQLAIRMVLFLFFFDPSGRVESYADLEQAAKTSLDIDRLVAAILGTWKTLSLPTPAALWFGPLGIKMQGDLAEALRDLRNFFVKNQKTPAMQGFLGYCGQNRLPVEDSLYSLVSTLVIAAFLGLDTPAMFGLKLFFTDYARYHGMFEESPGLFVKEVVRYLGVLPGTTTFLTTESKEIVVRGRAYTFPEGTPIMLLIGRADRDQTRFGQDSDEINPRRKGLERHLLSWNGREELIMAGGAAAAAKAPRHCPGHDLSIFLIARMLRLATRGREELFQLDSKEAMKIVLHDHASEPPTFDVDIKELHQSLSAYNKSYQLGFVPTLKDRNEDARWDKLPEPKRSWDKSAFLDAKMKFRSTQVFGVSLIEKDLYVDAWDDIILKFFDMTHNDSRVYAVKDIAALFDERDPARSRYAMKQYVKHKLATLSRNVAWKEMKSDHAMSLFAFGGVACHYTRTVASRAGSDSARRAPAGSRYMADATWMHAYEVREGLYRYGACAYFDAQCRLTGVYVSHLDELFAAGAQAQAQEESKQQEAAGGDAQLRNLKYAKYVWVTTVLASVTIKDHAIDSHIMEANALVTNTYEKLPLDHWLRRLLTIFTHGTVFINQNIFQLLLADKGFVHRIWGFDYETINKMGKDAVKGYKYIEYCNRFDPKMTELDDSIFPLNRDSKEFYGLMHKFVLEYVCHYDRNLEKDVSAKEFFEGVCRDLSIKHFPFNKANLASLLTTLFCVVTAYHEQVGSVMDNMGVELDWHDVKLYKKKADHTQMAKNDFVMLFLLGMATGFRNPFLINDFTHVLLKDKQRKANVELFSVWQRDLKALGDTIKHRNSQRRIPFQACNPRNLECSLSI